MNAGDNPATIEELSDRIKSLEQRLESSRFDWESLRPAQGGGFELPADDGEVKLLALELKAKRSEITDVKKLHMADMMLHFLSLWPALPLASRRYAFNMATLLVVALDEGWNEATQRANGFGPQLLVPVSNGHQTPVARTPVAAQVNGTQANPVAGTSRATTDIAGATGDIQMLEPAPLLAAVASPLRANARSPPSTPIKREAGDEAVGAKSPKAANCAGTPLAVGSPQPVGQSAQDGCPLTYKPKCKCKLGPAFRLQVRKDNQNHGRYFYKCFKSSAATPINPCNYFEWEDQLPVRAPKNCSHCGNPGHNKNNCPAK